MAAQTTAMLESLSEFWNETMQIDEARWVVWLTLLLILVLIAIYVALYFRNLALGINDGSSEDLSMFRKLKDEGKLDEQEFSDLKAAIPTDLPNKNTSEKSSND